jgi:hypothetical protein
MQAKNKTSGAEVAVRGDPSRSAKQAEAQGLKH